FDYHDRVVGFSRRHAASVTRRVIPGKVYLIGMFRCWLETVEASPVRPSADDVEAILDHWRRRLAGAYLLAAPEAPHRGDAVRGRRYVDTILDRGPAAGVGYWWRAMALRVFDRAPVGATEEERRDAAEIVDAFEAWGEELRRRYATRSPSS